MSDVSQGTGWWQASDGKWYPPEQHPNEAPRPTSGIEQAVAETVKKLNPYGLIILAVWVGILVLLFLVAYRA